MRRNLALGALGALTAAFVAVAPAAAADEDDTGSGTTPTATKLEQVSAYAEPSVVYLAPTWSGYVYDRTNKQYYTTEEPFTAAMQCTGFAVNPNGYIATAGHCVHPAEGKAHILREAAKWAIETGYYVDSSLDVDTIMGFNLVVVDEDGKRNKVDLDLQAAWAVSAGGVETGKALPARVVKRQSFEEGDGAIVKVETSDLNAMPLADSESLNVGTEIVSIGFPGSVDLVADASLSPTFKEGTVSQERTLSGGLLKAYEISAAVSGGMSGGPAVNLEGEVVGFNSFGINPDVETQSFNFVRPAQTVRELLADTGASNELSETTQAYRTGLDAFFSGDKAAAVESLESVVEAQPTNEFARRYLGEAKKLPDPPPAEESGFSVPWLWVAVGAGALVVLVGAGLVVMAVRRGKKRRGSTMPGAAPPPPAMPPPGPPAAPASGAPATAAPAASPPPAPPVGATPKDNGSRAGSESEPLTLVSRGATPTPTGAPAPAPTTAPEPGAVSPTDSGQAGRGTFCGNCGSGYEPGQKFCKECGSAL